MKVKKRNGSFEEVNLNKIVKSIERVCSGLTEVDVLGVATKTISGLYDGVTTKELDELSIETSVGKIIEDPIYSKVASRLLSNYILKEVENNEIFSFSQSIEIGYKNGLISEETYKFVQDNKRKLNNAINLDRNNLFEYYGLKTVYDRYLLRHPIKRSIVETPQYWLLRVACGLSDNVKEAIEFYNLISSLEYITSTPTLFNSGTCHSQMSSCYLLDSPLDDLKDIYKKYADVAQLSKWAGGIGLSYSKIRGAGALIKGTNGKSNGIIPWLHTLSSSVGAVNQGGRRKGSAAVYLEPHHPDIMEFLELKDNTGDVEKRAHNLNTALWISDLFMKRVEKGETWSLFDPSVCPDLVELFGDAYEKRYLEYEEQKKFVKQVPAKKIYARMMQALIETGNFWICFKDRSNNRCNMSVENNIVHSSNLCTEIILPTSKEETAVCNLGSINIAKYIKDGKLDKIKLKKNITLAVKFLDKVIDKNFYPITEAKTSNSRWRPVGLGIMGLQDFFFQLKVPFESDEALELSKEIQEEIYYHALKTSCDLAKEVGAHKDFKITHAAHGLLQFDLMEKDADVKIELKNKERWDELKEEIKKHGLRNSMLIAIAPTVSISAIAGASECIEPQKSNIFKYETLSGEFISVNKYLVEDLKKINLWNDKIVNEIKQNNGSIQHIANIPDELKKIYKTVWEISNKWIINHGIARLPFIDHSQSLNLFMAEATVAKASSMYMYAWHGGKSVINNEKPNGLKTTYYLRSKSATKIQQIQSVDVAKKDDEICESCQ